MTRIWYVIASLAVLVAVAIAVRGRPEQPTVVVLSLTPTAEAQTPTPTPTPRPVPKVRPSVKPPTPTYAEVAQQYLGRRIQFDAYCAVTPADNTFLAGTDVLLDNRSPDDRIVHVGDSEHILRGYGWKVISMTASASELPATLAIDCGTAKNVGKIVIEALTTPTISPGPTRTASVSPDFSPPASASASPPLDTSPPASASPSLSPTP